MNVDEIYYLLRSKLLGEILNEKMPDFLAQVKDDTDRYGIFVRDGPYRSFARDVTSNLIPAVNSEHPHDWVMRWQTVLEILHENFQEDNFKKLIQVDIDNAFEALQSYIFLKKDD